MTPVSAVNYRSCWQQLLQWLRPSLPHRRNSLSRKRQSFLLKISFLWGFLYVNENSYCRSENVYSIYDRRAFRYISNGPQVTLRSLDHRVTIKCPCRGKTRWHTSKARSAKPVRRHLGFRLLNFFWVIVRTRNSFPYKRPQEHSLFRSPAATLTDACLSC